MAAYTVRVELHQADLADYGRLHRLMALSGFKRTLVGDTGREDHLPTAMYVLANSALSCTQVRDQVAGIADPINRDAWIFVDESVQRAWRTAPVGKPNAMRNLPLDGGFDAPSRTLPNALSGLS